MNIVLPDTLRGQTILVVGTFLLLFHIVSLVPFIISSAATVTLEREEQMADRIVTITRLIDHADSLDRSYLAGEVSGPKFQVSVDNQPLTIKKDNSAVTIANLINRTLKPLDHQVTADDHDTSILESDAAGTQARDLAIQRQPNLFRIHEELFVSVDLPDGEWLNFRIAGSAWDHIFSLSTILSLTLMALGTILFAGWSVNKLLKSLSRFARASEDMGTNIRAAQPISEDGPREIRDAARAFNQMQARVKRLLEARNQMLGAISHDLRTPLTRLRLRVESILNEEQSNKAIRDLDDMETMIKLTLAFARDDATEESRESMDVGVVISEVVDDLNISADNISINTPESVRIMCQPVGLRRVLTNIIENGIFYGHQIRVELRREHNHVIIDVDDAGPGIDPQQRDRVFTPFYRLESSRNRETGGAGLGLSIAQTIVHAHGGTIELLDSPMGGLRVRIIFPEE
ncbi:MAG: ATP-binding protein [Gammaproteobacteria bacterium]|nr:ATP-binding protein [Gammaproteobacteria bacterium]